jgi:hypothetical protein
VKTLSRTKFISLYHSSQLFRNSVLSFGGWLLLYLVFLFEVTHLDWSSQHAKLSITPIGIPLGILIQWWVFGENIKRIVGLRSLKLTFSCGGKWLALKVAAFFANQVSYAIVLHQVGLPYMVAYPTAATVMSLVYFAINRFWTFRVPEAEEIETA